MLMYEYSPNSETSRMGFLLFGKGYDLECAEPHFGELFSHFWPWPGMGQREKHKESHVGPALGRLWPGFGPALARLWPGFGLALSQLWPKQKQLKQKQLEQKHLEQNS